MTRRPPKVLHAYVESSASRVPPGAVGVILMDDDARVHHRARLEVGRAADACERAFRGILYALWNARRFGYRRIAVHSDEPSAVVHLTDGRRVRPSLVGPYLEARALMHAYRSARVDVGQICWDFAGEAGTAGAAETDPGASGDLRLAPRVLVAAGSA